MAQARLTDAQRVILAEAAKRDDGSLLPVLKPDLDIAKRTGVVASLERRGFAEVFEVKEDTKKWRDPDDIPLGLRITASGLAAIGIQTNADSGAALPDTKVNGRASAEEPPTPPAATAKPSKQALLIDLLGRESGASLDEMVAATGWLPHTARAMLTGLRKKGHTLSSEKVAGVRRYRIVSGAPE